MRSGNTRTRRRASVALGLGLAFVAPGAGGIRAQQPVPAASAAPAGPSAPSGRSPLVAAVLQAAFPPLPVGYLYAGNVVRGLVPTALMVGGATLFLVETVEIIDWTTNNESDALLYLGFAATVGGYVFGIVDAANVARKRNAADRAAGVSLRVAPDADGLRIGLTIPLG